MLCKYARMAILEESQKQLFVVQSRSDFIGATLSQNKEFIHGRSTLYFSPRFVSEDLIAGVIEKKGIEKIKSGPWENEAKEVETFRTTNFAIRLLEGQEVAVQKNDEVFTGEAVSLLTSLASVFNDGTHNFFLSFRHMGSKKDLDDYIKRHSGSMRKVTITFEVPNSDYGHLQNLHDDLKESLRRIKGDRLKKEYQSSNGTLTPDDLMLDEMHLANEGTGSVQISNKDDSGNASSFNSEQTEFSNVVNENRRIDELSDPDEIRRVAEEMLNGAKANE